MVGSVAGDRSKEAVGMMALHESLRNVCLNSDWTYAVFWTIRPRPRVRGGNGCKVGDDSGSLMLMWEDGFCRGRVGEPLDEIDGEDPVRRAFCKMSIQLYNYGEGLMGKVASDKCHKWVFKEPSECEPNISNYWQSSFDSLPPEWNDQFDSGISTIAVIQAGHGLLQLGSCKTVAEDLHFVLRMRHTFESLGYQSGFYLSQLFSATRNASPSASLPSPKQSLLPMRPLPPVFGWTAYRPLTAAASPLVATPSFQSSNPRSGFYQPRDETHMFILPHHHHHRETQMHSIIPESESEIKWPNGLSFFNALTGPADDSKLLFSSETTETKADDQYHHHHHPNPNGDIPDLRNGCGQNLNEFLSLESSSNSSHHQSGGKTDHHKFRRSFTLPARMSSSSLMDHQNPHGIPGTDSGVYSDAVETFLE